jgi:hypothetical protein
MTESNDYPDLRWLPNVRVVHPQWGPGVITIVSRLKGDLHKVTVKFDSGRKETFEVDGSGRHRE